MDVEQTRSFSPLPLPLTSFIGREDICYLICQQLTSAEVRLLTLTGTGGVGKTRVALEVTRMIQQQFADGVCFVSLAALRDPGLVLPTVAQTLGLETGFRSPFAVVRSFLSDKRMLLVLDNLEHLLAAAPPFPALLAACPGLTLLVTSLGRLRIEGEHERVVSPLEIPVLAEHATIDPVQVSHVASVRLFVERAQARYLDFRLTEANVRAVAEICVRLDGLPLALELAAARSHLLPPQALLARLSSPFELLIGGNRDLPEHLQTLHNTIQWSYNFLTPEEQRLFHRCSIFTGGCTLSALEALYTGLGEDSFAVLDGISSLLEKSLLQRMDQGAEEPRFQMLEIIRTFGLRCLEANIEEAHAVRRSYAEYYLRLAKEAEAQFSGPEQHIWYHRIEAEIGNLRAVLDWSLTQDIELGLQFATALGYFWRVRNHLREIDRWYHLALPKATDAATDILLTARDWAGAAALLLEDYQRAEAIAEQNYQLQKERGNRPGQADALFILARIAFEKRSDHETAKKQLEECLTICREKNDVADIVAILCQLAWIASCSGEYQSARALTEEALAMSRERGDLGSLLFALNYLSVFNIDQARYEAARPLLEEGAEVAKTLVHQEMLCVFLANKALALIMAQEEASQIPPLLEESLRLAREGIGNTWVGFVYFLRGLFALSERDLTRAETDLEASWRSASLAHEIKVMMQIRIFQVLVPLERQELEQASMLLEECRRLVIEGKDQRCIMLYLETLALWLTRHNISERAARLLGSASALRARIDCPPSPLERALISGPASELARAQLGEQRFTAAWAEGEHLPSLSSEQVLHLWGSVSLAANNGTTSTNGRKKSDTLSPEATAFGLTRRELEVLHLVSEGLTNRQIAEQLILSVVTINSYLRSIFSKLDVSTRTAALRSAIAHHLL